MSGSVTLDRERDELVFQFPFNLVTKNAVKAIPGAQFDFVNKVWRVPAAQLANALVVAKTYAFSVEPGIGAGSDTADVPPSGVQQRASSGSTTASARVEPTSARGATSGRALARTENPDHTWTIVSLNASVSNALRRIFPTAVWVVGEIVNFNNQARRKHAYFALVDRDERDQPVAQINAVLFSSQRQQVERTLERAGLELMDGMRVRIRGRVELYEARGTYQFIADRIDVAFSEGELAVRREQVLRALREQNLIERNRRLRLPELPLRIALLTSASGDALHDFQETLRQAGYAWRVHVFDVRVQGNDLESSVVYALDQVRQHQAHFDVCVITRGGGSRVELSAWDNLAVAIRVAELPVKVIVAIGHQQDVCALDSIAESHKTPTAAATALVEHMNAAAADVEVLAEQIADSAVAAISGVQAALAQLGEAVRSTVNRTVTSERDYVRYKLADRLDSASRRSTTNQRRSLAAAHAALGSDRHSGGVAARRRVLTQLAARAQVAASRTLLAATRDADSAASAMSRQAKRLVRDAGAELTAAERLVAVVDPRRLLARGYAIVRDGSGAPLRSGRTLRAGDTIQVDMSDARIEADVQRVRPIEPMQNGQLSADEPPSDS